MKIKLKELEARYREAKDLADELYEQVRKLKDEIAVSEAKFPVGSVIALNKTKWIREGIGYRAKTSQQPYQEKYKIIRITNTAVYAQRIKKDGSAGAEKRLYSWDIEKAELVEPPK